MSTTTIGFLGAGEMGTGMVQRLLQQGHRVIVWSRTPAKHTALGSQGAELTDSLAHAVRDSDIVLGCLRDTGVTRDMYLGPGGVLDSATRGQILVEHGTFAPALAAEIALAAAARHAHFLDAPVSGGPERARSGELVTMVGGDQDAFERARRTIACYCRQLVWTGAPGSGQRLKLINQLLVTIHVVAAAEASALVVREGIDPAIAHAVLMGGWGGSAMLDRELPRACAGEFGDSGATVGKLIDVQPMIADLLAAARVESRLFGPARAVFDETAAAGRGDEDLAAVVTRYV